MLLIYLFIYTYNRGYAVYVYIYVCVARRKVQLFSGWWIILIQPDTYRM